MTFNDRTLNEVNIIWATPLCTCAAVHRPRCPLSASDLCVTLTDSPALPDPRPCQLFYKTLRHSWSCRKSALLVVAQQREEVAVSPDVVEVEVAHSARIPKEGDGQVRPPSPPQDSSDHHDEEELPITADRLLTIIRSEVERLIPDSLRQTPPLVTNSTGRVR